MMKNNPERTSEGGHGCQVDATTSRARAYRYECIGSLLLGPVFSASERAAPPRSARGPPPPASRTRLHTLCSDMPSGSHRTPLWLCTGQSPVSGHRSCRRKKASPGSSASPSRSSPEGSQHQEDTAAQTKAALAPVPAPDSIRAPLNHHPLQCLGRLFPALALQPLTMLQRPLHPHAESPTMA